MPDPAAVNSMFGRIARRYDLANFVLCGGVDRWWRRRLVRAVAEAGPRDVLDLATGSGDVAFALCRGLGRGTRILGMDFCAPMLDQAEIRKRAAPAELVAQLEFRLGDGLALPLPDAAFDAVTISFGLRNLADRARGLGEMRRVLRAGGRLVVLEFSQPHRWFRPIYYAYLRYVLPPLAGIVTGDRGAYEYLNRTIGEFPDRLALAREIEAAGFSPVRAVPLSLGIVALHIAERRA